MVRVSWQSLLLPVAAAGVALAIWAAAIPLAHTRMSEIDWARAMVGLGIVVCLVVVQYARSRPLSKWVTAAMLTLTLGAAVCTVDAGIRRHYLKPRQVASWNFFHYYLGGKYFKELGYEGLYEEVLKADGAGRFSRVKRYRDMSSYQLKPASQVKRKGRREAWTDERWAEFRKDVRDIGRLENKRFWPQPLIDRGYNPPPGWVLLGGTLAKLFSPASGAGMTIMMLADPVLLLLAFWYSTRVYGWWRSLMVLAGGALWIGSYRLFGGKLVQYDWLAAMWGALACLKRERWATAGALIAYGTSVRIFPFVLFVGPGLYGLWQWARTRVLPPGILRLALSGAASLLLLVGLSGLAGGRGLGGWQEFATSISEHNYHQRYTETRVGLPYLTTMNLETGISAKVPRSVRKVIYDDNHNVRIFAQALLMVLLIVAARRETAHDAAIMGLLVLFAFAVSSRYYGVVYCLLLLRHVQHLRPSALPTRYFLADLLFFAATLVGYVPTLFDGDAREIYMAQGFALTLLLLYSATLSWRAAPTAKTSVAVPA